MLNSASIIQALLGADLVDDLRFALVPDLIGGGLRCFPAGIRASSWSLADATTFEHGAVGLHYRRVAASR